MPEKKNVAIIGGGPSALILASTLDPSNYNVSIFEKNTAPGRKFLVAGNGGLNLTHSEPLEILVSRYKPSSFFNHLLNTFGNQDLCNWFRKIGIETFAGSSKRIFPLKGIKPVAVLNAVLNEVKLKGVKLHTHHEWVGWNPDGKLIMKVKENLVTVDSDYTVFALGGSSWKKTGSDGKWVDLFKDKGISIIPFQASNCSFTVNWNKEFIAANEGKWLKNVKITCKGITKPGEIVITANGIEGGPVYALSQEIRNELASQGKAQIYIDLKADVKEEEISKILIKRKKSVTDTLKSRLNLNDVQIALLNCTVTKEEYFDSEVLARRIKQFPVEITGTEELDKAISTTGGISLDEIDESFELKKLKKSFAIGEMLDWDAPTGGYLLQACFSMGYFLGDWLNKIREDYSSLE